MSPLSLVSSSSFVPAFGPGLASSFVPAFRPSLLSVAAAAIAAAEGVATSALQSGHVALALVSHGRRHARWNACPHCCSAIARSPAFRRAWHTGHSSPPRAFAHPSSKVTVPGTAAIASSLSTRLPLSSEPRFAAARRAARSAAIRRVAAFAAARLSSTSLRLAVRSASKEPPLAAHASHPTRSAVSTGVSSR